MRVVVLSTRALGEKIVEALLSVGQEVVGVYGSPVPEGVTDRMEVVAARHGIPFQTVRKTTASTDAFFEEYAALRPDINIMGGLRAFLPEKILYYPRLGTVGWHPSALPRYAGANSLCWPIIFGEKSTANTVFWADGGIDSGPILLQREIPIDEDDTFLSLYRNKVVPGAIELILEAVKRIEEGTAPRIPQDLSKYTYYSFITEKDAVIRWKEPGRRIYDLIRGTNPNPGASTSVGGETMKVYDVEYQPGFSPEELRLVSTGRLKAGTVSAIDENGIRVAVPDGVIVIRTAGTGGKKAPAAEVAEALHLAAGTQLGV